jgi:serine/threonine-protein kinase
MSLARCPHCAAPTEVGALGPGQAAVCAACQRPFRVSEGPRGAAPLGASPLGASPLGAAPLGATQQFAGGALPTLVRGPGLPAAAALPGGSEPTVTPSRAGALQAAAAASAAGEPEVALPGYALLELLGRGGMGEVWRARQLSLGRTVAVKLLPPRLAADPEFVARFDKEAMALAALSHPAIVQIIDRGHVGAHYYFVMELVEGRSLRQVLEQGGLPVAEALRVVLQVARALECAHEAGITHRDLKPENVLLDARGHAKVADFGLAGIRGAEVGPQLTATHVAMGTLNYMAPEQRRDARSVDGRADLYSLGVVLYELLTGQLPLGRFALPSQKVPGLDPSLDALVVRLLEADREARLPSASPLVAELEGLLARMTTGGPHRSRGASRWGAAPAGGPASAAASPSRRALRAGLLAVGAAGALGLGVGLWRSGGAPLPVRNAGAATPPAGPAAPGPSTPGPTPGLPGTPAAGAFPPNTNRDLMVSATYAEKRPDGTLDLRLDFVEGKEELNARMGHWRLEDGLLRSTQAGAETGGKKLRPRTYVAHHYFSADDFVAETTMTVAPLPAPYQPERGGSRFGELSFRIAGVQVSVFAVPDEGMRLLWHYAAEDGRWVSGSSADAVARLVEDHQPVPRGPFKVRLALRKVRGGVEATGSVNGVRFARQLLPDLQGRVAKVALGCRNSDCAFEGLTIRGKAMPRPRRDRLTESGE